MHRGAGSPATGDPSQEGTFQLSMTVSRVPEDIFKFFFERINKVKKESQAAETATQSSKDKEECVHWRD